MYTPLSGVRYGDGRATGRAKIWRRSMIPPLRSPPTRLAFRRPRALGRLPRHRAVERPIKLERRRSVAVALEGPAVARGEPGAGESRHLVRTQVQDHDFRRPQLVEARHWSVGEDLAAVRAEAGRQRICESLGPTPDARPAHRLPS